MVKFFIIDGKKCNENLKFLLLKDVTRAHLEKHCSNFDSILLLEHAKKTAEKSIKKSKSPSEAASLPTETLLKENKNRFHGLSLYFSQTCLIYFF